MSNRILLLLNKIFLKALFCSFRILFWLVKFVCPHSWDPYSWWEEKREWYVILRVLWDVLFLSLLSIPVVWFSFVVTWFICFDYSKWSSKRYFAVLVGVKCFPSSLNLRLWSIFFELEWKMISSVLVKLRDSLLAFSRWDRFLRSKFIRLATFFGELSDCSILVSSAKW